MSTEIEKRIKGVVIKKLHNFNREIRGEDRLVEDLGLDSLDLVELMMAVEEEFGVEIPDSEAEKIKTVQDVMKFIKNAEESSADTA